jgi:RNA polymerase sigma-70 factor (ECF subfamily)
LIERARRDPEAFAVLYRRYYDGIASYVFHRLGDPHTTEDVVSDVFLAAIGALRRFQYRGVPLKAWLYRIATNAVNRRLKRNPRRPRETPLEEEPAIGAAADDRDGEAARAAMLSLSPKFQTVLSLHYLEGMSVEEAASVIGCRVGTVKSRLSRARNALRQELLRRR